MFFQHVEEAPPDPIFGLTAVIAADPRSEKINLTAGIYQDENGQAELLQSVRRAKERIACRIERADYLPIDGLSGLIERLGGLIFGEEAWRQGQSRIYAAHTTGGTAALRVGSEFLVREVGKRICLPDFTWPNHRLIVERAGAKGENYPYYSREKRGFDAKTFLQFLAQLPEKTVVLLHPCCHNPTGCDPKIEDWQEISFLMKKKGLLPFFDFAYQGLGDGLQEDAAAVRHFLKEGHQMLIAYSCSKNFSMYCHRVGALFAVGENGEIKRRIGSQIKQIIRALYSNPPAEGAWIVNEVLTEQDLRTHWQEELRTIRQRLQTMRKSLVQKLMAQAKKHNFQYLSHHQGMFSFLSLERRQVEKLQQQFAIYLLENGRINIAGLNSQNIDRVVKGILTVCEEP